MFLLQPLREAVIAQKIYKSRPVFFPDLRTPVVSSEPSLLLDDAALLQQDRAGEYLGKFSLDRCRFVDFDLLQNFLLLPKPEPDRTTAFASLKNHSDFRSVPLPSA